MQSELEENASNKEELSKFLEKVDQVGSLVRDLTTSHQPQDTQEALQRADEYLENLEGGGTKRSAANGGGSGDRVVHDRTVINAGSSGSGQRPDSENPADFLKALEEDARERGERRKERESRGREHKKNGNAAFRSGQYSDAVEQYSQALTHTPWDVSLYTNRALAYNRLGHHNEAIADCDAAIKVEPHTLKAYLQKAKALTAMYKTEEAEQCYCEARRLFPDKADLMVVTIK